MKINDYISGAKGNAYTTDAKAAGSENTARSKNQPLEEQNAGDRVELSNRSREIARAQELAGSAPDIRTEKVAELKARIQAGTYDVNARKVAEAMIRGSIDETV